MIITLETPMKGINLPGIGIRTFKNLEVVDENSEVGKILLESFPQYCNTKKVVQNEPIKEELEEPVLEKVEEEKQVPELLLETPIQDADVTTEEPVEKSIKRTRTTRATKTNKLDK